MGGEESPNRFRSASSGRKARSPEVGRFLALQAQQGQRLWPEGPEALPLQCALE